MPVRTRPCINEAFLSVALSCGVICRLNFRFPNCDPDADVLSGLGRCTKQHATKATIMLHTD